MPQTGSGSGSGQHAPGTRGGRWPKGGIASAAAEVLRRAGGPLTLDALGAELAAEWDLGEGWRNRLRGALREHVAICRVATGTYDLLERRLAGARLWHTLTEAEVRHGLLLADPDLEDLLLWWQATPGGRGEVQCSDGSGRVFQAAIAHLTGPHPIGAASAVVGHGDRLYSVLAGLAEWLQAERAQAGDEVCFSPEPPDARRFRLSLERGGAHRTALQEADAVLAETALAILRDANTVVSSHHLLRRLAGRMDLRTGQGVHLPVFVLGRDPRFAFDGVFYSLRAVGEAFSRRRIASPYPRPEDYPADWPGRDPMKELERHVEAMLPEALRGDRLSAVIGRMRDQMVALTPDLVRRAAQERAATWDLLQDRSRLLNPPTGADGPTGPRPARGKVIRGPWPG